MIIIVVSIEQTTYYVYIFMFITVQYLSFPFQKRTDTTCFAINNDIYKSTMILIKLAKVILRFSSVRTAPTNTCNMLHEHTNAHARVTHSIALVHE